MYHLLSALLLLSVCVAPIYPTVSPSDVAQASFGSFDFKELEEVLYDVEIDDIPTTVALFENKFNKVDSEPPSDSDETQKEPKHHRLTLTSKYGQEYFCKLPDYDPEVVQDKDDDTTGSSEGGTKFNVSALLQPLTKEPCLMKSTGWWTYEYCHGKYVSQFHKEAGAVTKTLLLGVYENETHWTEEKINKVRDLKDSMKNNLANQQFPLAYHAVSYVNGTECDLNGKPRRTKVKIVCGLGEDKIVDIQETETCNYTIQVQTQLLCSHPFFGLKSATESQLLECAPIVSQQYYEYLETKAAMRNLDGHRLKKDDDPQPASDHDTVGENRDSIETDTLTKFLTSFLSNPGLFDSGEEGENDNSLFAERETSIQGGSDVENDAKLKTKRASDSKSDKTGSVGQETDLNQQHNEMADDDSDDSDDDDKEEELLALRMNRLKEAVDSLYSRMIQELEEVESEQPTKNVLKHTMTEMSDSDSDGDSESQSGSENLEEGGPSSDKPFEVQSRDEHYSPSGETSTDYEKESFQFQTKSSKDVDTHKQLKESNDEEPQTVAEYLEKMKKKKLNSLKEDLSNGKELNERELGLLEELDEEALFELEAEINEELQRHLKDAGLDGQAQIEVKVFNLPSSVIDNLDHIEDEEDDSTQSQKKSTSGTVKVLNVRLAGDQLFDGSTKAAGSSSATVRKPDFSKMLNSYLNPMTPERLKVQRLESGYNRARFDSMEMEEDSDSDGEKEEEFTGP